jgi:hypothetical protein
VKYQCPELARVKFDISPETQVSGILRSNNCATALLSAETLMTALVAIEFEGRESVFMRHTIKKAVHRSLWRSPACHYDSNKSKEMQILNISP